ncbi:MAG: NERD domain-containing protein [Eubacteriales bacterium]|nr:NERD domain-containing protein [Candidatus Colimorpha enterica]
MTYFIIAIIIAVFIAIAISACRNDNGSFRTPYPDLSYDEREIYRAGEEGEYLAASAIKSILFKDDWHTCNFEFSVDGREAECDILVVNTNGIFIFEVKNFSGSLFGYETDDIWEKVKESDSGNLYSKEIKNPIKQVRRQRWLLKKLLGSYGIYNFRIDGYVLLVNANPHDESEYILTDLSEVERIIHTPGEHPLNKSKRDAVISAINAVISENQAA